MSFHEVGHRSSHLGTRSATEILPASTSSNTAAAVKLLLTDASWNCVSSRQAMPSDESAMPLVRSDTILPARMTRAAPLNPRSDLNVLLDQAVRGPSGP